MAKEKIRVLHCPSQVGGNPGALAKYEREIGLNSWCVSEEESYLNYSSDEILAGGAYGSISTEWRRFKLWRRALFNADVLHLNNGRFIYPYFGKSLHPREEQFGFFLRRLVRIYAWSLVRMEYASYRISGKCVFITFQGSDARQKKCFINGHQSDDFITEYLRSTGVDDQSKEGKIISLSRCAKKIYSLNPDLLTVLPEGTEFLPYCSESVASTAPVGMTSEGPLVIGHAPTNRSIKGTDRLQEAVNRLQREGHSVELRLIEGLDHSSAQREFKKVDIMVDQLIIGWYGVLAVELMALGKPVIAFVGGKGLKGVPKKMLTSLPVINTNNTSIYDKLRECVKLGRSRLGVIGMKGVEYVRRWHDPETIAKRVNDDYQRELKKMGRIS